MNYKRLPFLAFKSIAPKRIIQLIIINLLLALGYGITAQLSVELASLPGKVTIVWIPAGLTLAAVRLMGWWALPGIAIGSVAGVLKDLLEMMPPLSMLQVIVLNLVFAAANCLQPLVATALIKKLSGNGHPFYQVHSTVIFIFAAIVAPTISATLGITAWCWTGVVPWSSYGVSWLTWWLASGLAHVIFTPPFLLWQNVSRHNLLIRAGDSLFALISLLGLCWLIFIENYSVEYVLLPVLIWAVFRLGKFYSSVLIGLVSAIAIVATAHGFGPLVKGSLQDSLIVVQSFVAVCSLTTLMLSALIEERHLAQKTLQQTLDTLEQQVNERTLQLKQSKALLNGFFSSAPVGMGIVDAQLRFRQINGLLAQMNGSPPSDHIGKRIREVIPDLAPMVEPLYRQVLATGKPLLNREISGTIKQKNQPGIQQTWLISYFPIFNPNADSQAEPCGVGSVVLDISDRKQVELALEESEERYRSAITALAEGVVLQDVNGVIYASNASAKRILGASLGWVMGDASRDAGWQAMHEDGSPFPKEEHPSQVTLRTGQPSRNVTMGVHDANGCLIWLLMNAQPLIRLGEVLPYAVVTSFSDTTELKQKEVALQQSEAINRQILKAIPDLIIWMDKDGTVLARIHGAKIKSFVPDDQDVIGRNVREVFPPELAQTRIDAIHAALETGDVQVYEQELIIDNAIHYEEVRVVMVGTDRALIMVRDISEHKRAEDALKAQQEFLQQVIDAMPSTVFVKDVQGRILTLNQAAANIHGTTVEALLGKYEYEVNTNCDRTQVELFIAQNQEVIDSLKPKLFPDQAITNCHGETRWYQTIISPFWDRNGDIKGVIGNSIDVTERRQMELALREANEELQRRATVDGLTQIANRRRFDEYLTQEWYRLAREQQPLSLILCDVDFFKRYNDHYGHQAGDDCLVQIAQTLHRALKRSTDLVARYGGEEFAVVLPNTKPPAAIKVAQMIQEVIKQQHIPHATSEIADYITMSLGITALVPGPNASPELLITMADQALYHAKAKGRNTYCLHLS
ncbi:MAG TPA: diguanylate cyclase [Crinalium sp.]|jgi:diguanylate cyclase (GGDEF)-like protein/PAS domain S-box-containing protein